MSPVGWTWGNSGSLSRPSSTGGWKTSGQTTTRSACPTTSGTSGRNWSPPIRSNVMEVRSQLGTKGLTSGSSRSTRPFGRRVSKPTTSWASTQRTETSTTQSLCQMIRTCARSLGHCMSLVSGRRSRLHERMDTAITWSKRSRETASTTTSDAQELARYAQLRYSIAKTLVKCGMPWSQAMSVLDKLQPMPSTKRD